MFRTGTAYVEVSEPKHPGKTWTALGLASIAIAPIVAFAIVWAGLLAILGVMWLADAIGFI